jgi:phosphoglycolate phosphatase
MSQKLCVVFPGRRYSCDRSLLYYPSCYLQRRGFEMIYLHYDADRETKDMIPLSENFAAAYKETEKVLADIDFAKYDEIIFLSKSLGTVVASQYGADHHIDHLTHIYFTPVDRMLPFIKENDLIFAARTDSYMENTTAKLSHFPHAHILDIDSHSMEDREDELHSLKIMEEVMKILQEFYK